MLSLSQLNSNSREGYYYLCLKVITIDYESDDVIVTIKHSSNILSFTKPKTPKRINIDFKQFILYICNYNVPFPSRYKDF